MAPPAKPPAPSRFRRPAAGGPRRPRTEGADKQSAKGKFTLSDGKPRAERPPRAEKPERIRSDGPAKVAPPARKPRVPSSAPGEFKPRYAIGKPKTRSGNAPTARSPDRPEGDRIAKLLARAGIASRRDIERMIAEGRIALNGETLTTPATILTSLHGVTVDGQPVAAPAPARLFLFHKPAGCLTAERDPKGRPTIYDHLPADLPRLMPVGRLDYNTEGLLLLTNDGEFKRLLELPRTGVERTYRARAFGEISQEALESLIMGIEIDGMHYGRIDANLERRTGHNQWVEMTLTEGKNREVRRVLEHFGLEVNRLIRTRYGPFVLGDSAPGTVEEVRQHDLVVFRKTLEAKGPKK